MKVTLIKEHTHAGEAKQAGDVIDVDAPTAQWLAAQGAIEATLVPVEANPKKATKE